jgi:Ser/Thr protein kinase RdoA (MazF antagonist)
MRAFSSSTPPIHGIGRTPLSRHADADLVRRDRDLPDLALLLDSDRLTERLERMFGRSSVAGVSVRYLRYKPTQNCLAACHAEVDGQSIDLVLKTYRASAVAKLHKGVVRHGSLERLGPGRFILDGSMVVVAVFPDDAKLKQLARVASPDSLARLADRIGVRGTAESRLETLRHNPERRFVGRLVVDDTNVATVRCYTARDFAGVVAKAGALRSRGPLKLAQQVTQRRRWRLLAFEWLDGNLLEHAIRQRTVSSAALRVVGAALAHVHDQEAPALPQRTGGSEAAALIALARQLAFVHPPIAASAGRLAERLAARLVAQPLSTHPLHGDFYARQVILDGDLAALIDLDEAALGDPAIDLARFSADLEATVVAGGLEAREIEPLVESLLEGYGRVRALPATLHLHIAAQLVRVAAHPFRRREPSWPEMTAAILSRAGSFLARRASGRGASARGMPPPRAATLTPTLRGSFDPAARVRVIDPFAVTSDALMPFLVQALSPGDMARRFVQALSCTTDATYVHIGRIVVMRHKPGRRCLIGYDLTVRDARGTVEKMAVVGKARARGVDRNTHELLATLWAGPFGASAADGMLVPEPLGVVDDVHMGVQRRVSGRTLTGRLEGASGLELACRVAAAIHKLHRCSAPARRRHLVEDEMRILRAGLTAVEQAHPRWRARIARVFDGCMRLTARIPEWPLCGVHRDFYPDQVLIDGDRLYLTDLDLYAQGPPALDVGNFVAHVEEYSLRRYGAPDHLADRAEMFIERYLQLSGRTTRQTVDAWATLSLARQLAISERLVERRPFIPALLDLCESRLFGASDNGRRTRPVCPREKGATP